MTTSHVVPVRLYVLIFAALVALTGLTVLVSFYDLGGGRLYYGNAVVAVTIAVTKAALVVLYFMHARYSPRLIWVLVGTGILWLLILLVLTLADFLTRSWLPLATWGG